MQPRLNGESIPIDCWSLHDHSWGPRRLEGNPRTNLSWAIKSTRDSFGVIGAGPQPATTDPGVGVDDRIVIGWRVKDGEVGHFSSGVLRVESRDSNGHIERLSLITVDSLGRVLEATATATSVLAFQGFPGVLLWWTQLIWDYEGTQVTGEIQDMWPLQHARLVQRSVPAGG